MEQNINNLSFQELYSFLKEVDNDFITPLSKRSDLKLLSHKMIDNAQMYSFTSQEEIIAVCACYCNNIQKQIAYIPFFSVKKAFKNNGLGKKLILFVIDDIKKTSMKKIMLHAENPAAIHVYESVGFKSINDIMGRKEMELFLEDKV